MKRFIAMALALILALALCACSSDDIKKAKDAAKSGQDVINGAIGSIEDNKDKIKEGLDDLQKIADDAWAGLNGSR